MTRAETPWVRHKDRPPRFQRLRTPETPGAQGLPEQSCGDSAETVAARGPLSLVRRTAGCWVDAPRIDGRTAGNLERVDIAQPLCLSRTVPSGERFQNSGGWLMVARRFLSGREQSAQLLRSISMCQCAANGRWRSEKCCVKMKCCWGMDPMQGMHTHNRGRAARNES